jgi:ParB/RepB/Spo0J family partition protein
MTQRMVISVAVATLIAQNIRSSMNDERFRNLVESLRKKGQQVPILISGTTIIDGHRRVAAAPAAGLTELDAIDCGGMTAQEIRDFQTLHAFHAEELPDYDRARALEAKAKETGWGNAQLADFFNINPSDVTQLRSLPDCIPAVQQLAAQGKIGPSKWYAISQSPDQEACLNLTRDEIWRRNKQARRNAPAVRTKTIKCPLPTGVTVQVAGEDVSLDEAADALAAAAKLVKFAIDKGYNAKTAQSMWKDSASAG